MRALDLDQADVRSASSAHSEPGTLQAVWRWAVVLASSFAVACSGRLADVPDASADAPAEALGPTPCSADPSAECPPRFVQVSWFADDGGLERCECYPPGEVQCVGNGEIPADGGLPETPLGRSLCQCNVCGPMRVQTWSCVYDPYYGNLTSAYCIE